MKHPLITATLFLLLGASSLADVPTAFDQANRQFEAGEFTDAAAGYEALLEQQGPNAAAYYNLGNAWQKLGRYGPAILAYERARLLTPRDPDLLANLALARKAAAAFETPALDPRLDAVLKKLSPDEWSWIVVGSALFLGCLGLLSGVIRPSRKWMRPTVITTALIACFTLTIAASALYLQRGESKRAIVLTEGATIRLSPFETAESLGTPGPGRMVIPGRTSGGFTYVEVPSTQLRGWISSKDVAPIIP